jgi:hypothetical protein
VTALAPAGLGVPATRVIKVPQFLLVWRGAPIPRGATFASKQELLS